METATVIFVDVISRDTLSISFVEAEVPFAYDLPSSLPRRILRGFTSLLVSWHLLSLDAPCVAVAWTTFTAAAYRTRLSLAYPLAMGLAVWAVYIIDRLLDTKHLSPNSHSEAQEQLEARHFFSHHYRGRLLAVTAGSVAAILFLITRFVGADLLLYSVESIAMVAYFLLVHANQGPTHEEQASLIGHTNRIPKEISVGPFFAAAVFIPTISRRPELRPAILPLAVLFALICILNCLYIFSWEKKTCSRPHWTTMWSIRNLKRLTWVYVLLALGCWIYISQHNPTEMARRSYPLACVASAIILFVIHHFRQHFSKLILRALADAALLTPLIIAPFLLRQQL